MLGALQKVQKLSVGLTRGSRDRPGGPGGVRRPFRRSGEVGRPYQRSRCGREAIQEVREESVGTTKGLGGVRWPS